MRPDRLIALLSVLGLANAFLGCASGADQDLEVVERSKAKAPAWIADSAAVPTNDKNSFVFSSQRDKFASLPVAIKASQLQALDSGKTAFTGKIEQQVHQIADENKIKIENSDDLQQIIKRVTKIAAAAAVNVADLYYEKSQALYARDPSNVFYQVFVLVDVQSDKIPLAVSEIAQQLQRSAKPDLKKLGKALTTFGQPFVSH